MFVHVTFDLIDADSADYPCIKQALAEMGLLPTVETSDGRNVGLPANTFVGKFPDVDDPEALASEVRAAIQDAFKRCRVKGPIFISAGKFWAWASSTPR